jgi:hypothetical protein
VEGALTLHKLPFLQAIYKGRVNILKIVLETFKWVQKGMSKVLKMIFFKGLKSLVKNYI